MKFKQLALASSICALIAGGTGIANAAIPGIPGEALLVPLVLTGANDVLGVETYVGLTVPQTLGTDQLINVYTAPHTSSANVITTQQPVPYRAGATAPEIFWTLYDEESKKVQDGRCEVSSGDMVVWTTDPALRALQQAQTSQIAQAGVQGVPSSICGPTNRTRFGYVVFQTMPGADGQDADFAFAGDATIAAAPLLATTFSVPVMPMADGADPVGQTTPLLYNEVVAGGNPGDLVAASPLAVAPILAGIRMNDADQIQEDVVVQAPIQGPRAGSGMSLHVFWFDRNDTNRVASLNIWDDQEGTCSDTYPLPREVNLALYNASSAAIREFTPPTWININGITPNVDQSVVDLISVIKPPLFGYTDRQYCAPDYWTARALNVPFLWGGALAGYVEYTIPEIGEPAATGFVNSAAVAFNLQEGPFGPGEWSSHMSLDRGKH
jgi:hypothetical protein